MGERRVHCKYQGLSAMSCARMVEPINLPFGLWTWVGRRKHKFNRIYQVAPMCPHGKAHWRHLANTTEPSDCGGDAVLCQITLTTCYTNNNYSCLLSSARSCADVLFPFPPCADFPAGVELADDTTRAPKDCSQKCHTFSFLWLATLTFEPQIRTWGDFCTMHLTAKFPHPMFNRSEIIVLTNKQTPLKTSTSLRYATRVNRKHLILQ